VRAGESLASIAKRYRTNPTQLAGWNKGVKAVRAGQVLTVYVPQRAAVAKASIASKASKSKALAKTSIKGKTTVAKSNGGRQPANKSQKLAPKAKLAKR
jgi:membrane-bound lytic murein transglycosylase D